MVQHEADVRLIDAHTESDCSHDDLRLVVGPCLLCGSLCASVHLTVVHAYHDSFTLQILAHLRARADREEEE